MSTKDQLIGLADSSSPVVVCIPRYVAHSRMGKTTRFSMGFMVFAWFASFVALALSAINHWAFGLTFSFVAGSHFAMGIAIRFAFDLVEKTFQPPLNSPTSPSSEPTPNPQTAAEILSPEAAK